MSYLALYRRFRPTTFDNVIGQDHVVKTLTNQIKTQSIGHAYLFCGSRGTGKTSIAKIFAKAVNCLEPVNGSPCYKCEACKTLLDPSNIDIIEIDAASNNKVENVRDIRDNVQYAPVGVKYKVYIIDEVHMLTTEAFNALLKTLEEPPKHAVFILATTEPQKLPATILSRCMRFDFKLVSDKENARLIAKVYDEIGKKYTEEAVFAIARAGEGCVRDALSVADLCVSIGGEVLEYQDVLSVLGATDSKKTDNIVRAIFNNDIGSVLSCCDELVNTGKSIGMISKDLISYLRDIAVVKSCKNASDILSLPKHHFEELAKTAQLCDEHRILRVLEILTKEDASLRYASRPRAVFETALIRATMPQADYNIDALLSRVNKLEEELIKIKENGVIVRKTDIVEDVAPIKEPIKQAKEKQATKQVESVEPTCEPEEFIEILVDEQEPIYDIPYEEESVVEVPKKQEIKKEEPKIEKESKVETVKDTALESRKIWGTIVRRLRSVHGKIILWVACQEMSATIIGNNFVINAGGEPEKKLLEEIENRQLLEQLLSEFGSYNLVIKCGDDSQPVLDKSQTVTEFFGEDKTIIK